MPIARRRAGTSAGEVAALRARVEAGRGSSEQVLDREPEPDEDDEQQGDPAQAVSLELVRDAVAGRRQLGRQRRDGGRDLGQVSPDPLQPPLDDGRDGLYLLDRRGLGRRGRGLRPLRDPGLDRRVGEELQQGSDLLRRRVGGGGLRPGHAQRQQQEGEPEQDGEPPDGG